MDARRRARPVGGRGDPGLAHEDGVLANYPNLRVLCAVAAGVDKLLRAGDIPAHVPVTRVVDLEQCQQIAQYVVAARCVSRATCSRYAEQQAQARWQRHRPRPASRCRIGVLGLGSVGHANRARSCHWGIRWRDGRATRGSCPASLRTPATAGSRRCSPAPTCWCALPLTAATRGLLCRDTLAQLPQGAYVINVGRGEQLVEPDLRALLNEGHLAGAALDVFEREPPAADNWVWSHPLVLATPHIAGECRARWSRSRRSRRCTTRAVACRSPARWIGTLDTDDERATPATARRPLGADSPPGAEAAARPPRRWSNPAARCGRWPRRRGPRRRAPASAAARAA